MNSYLDAYLCVSREDLISMAQRACGQRFYPAWVISLSFEGHYPPGSEGNDAAIEMTNYTLATFDRHDPKAMFFDFEKPGYVWGDDEISAFCLRWRESRPLWRLFPRSRKRCQYKHAKQKKYHVRNWAEYNEGLRRRGDLTVWFDEEAIANWKADKTGKPGGQRVYSDMAIETGLVVRMVYKLAYRQTEGFLHSIASLLGLGIEIPDYSTLCRRSRLLRKKLRIPKAASTQPIHLMIDSTGLRIHVGNARKPPKQRAWRKLHIAVDRETGNIVASELTASRARDATRVPALLTQIQAPLVSVAADSAYDKEAVYEAIEAHSPGRRTRVVIPPQRNATLSQNSNTAMQERDRHIRAIERHGRREWYKLSGYTKRSMVENAVYRYKAIIGPEMRARTLARQRVEHRIGCEILNKMAALGMPDTYCAG